ncbi:hypothetical protein AGOR_G00136110 [Albula goreensis]|uniref:Sushi domain-containing protein n=1 Tax=Albula goreensis TaxID=1534307 RepID=A0A8T3D8T5_9TELE|nr:hypothetical protein AGOR_G00136110 [Albula goreensis]
MLNLWGNIMVLGFCFVPEFTASRYCALPKDYPNTKLRDQRVKTVYNPGSSVYYDCTPGYRRVIGSPFVRCRYGQWTPLNMKCERKLCGSAGEILNGYFDYMEEASFGDSVAAVCSEGYHLKGNRYRLCQDSGWSGEIPSCEEGAEITCPSPSVANGVKVKGEARMYSRGNNVTFTCMDGFSLRGFREVTCGSDSLWHPRLPECLPSSVGSGRITIFPTINPVDEDVLQEDSPVGYCTAPNNYPGTVIADQHLLQRDFPPGTEVRYTCAPGYRKLRGGKVVSLCANGMWTTIDLKCERKSCGSAGEILNGHYEYVGILFGDTVSAVCSEGYEIIGRTYRQCRDQGWDGVPPVCEAVKCPDPPEVVNGVRTGTQEGPFVYSTVIGYRCQHGKLIGNREIYCRQDGTWSGPPPQCQTSRRTCLAPTSYPNMHIPDHLLSQRDFLPGTEVHYTCALGYQRTRGNTFISHCVNGRWTAIDLECERKSCGSAGEIPNGHYEYMGTSFGDTVSAVCNEGYKIIGHNYRQCHDQGWDGVPPVCEEDPPEITCPKPSVANGVVVKGEVPVYKKGNSVTFSCTEGFSLSGSWKITCGPDGQWHPNPPECLASNDNHGSRSEEGNCSVPVSYPSIVIMDLLQRDFPPGTEVRYTCAPGYRKLRGSKVVSLCANGMWTPVNLKCERKSCGSAGEILNGYYEYIGVLFGDTVSAVCNEGYEMIGRNYRECRDQGWDGVPPVCEAVKCADPPEVVNGVRSGPHEGPFIYSTVIGYRCLQGQLIGKSEIYCMQDGKWSGPPPECKDITCDYPYVEHGRRTGGYSRKYRYKDYVSFECQEGYHLSGPSTVTCGPAGQWTPSLPQCKAVTCSPLKVDFAEMGRIDTEHKYGESVIVTCMKGYKLNGKKRITCGSLGQWAPYLPQCQPITCRRPEIHSANMTVMEKVYKSGDSVSVTCKTPYILRGPSSIQCGSTGRWIPNLPKCLAQYKCPPLEIPNGIYLNRSRIGVTIRVRCEKFFELRGPADLTCLNDLTWHPKTLPICVIKDKE